MSEIRFMLKQSREDLIRQIKWFEAEIRDITKRTKRLEMAYNKLMRMYKGITSPSGIKLIK